jgi:hypothetical protein
MASSLPEFGSIDLEIDDPAAGPAAAPAQSGGPKRAPTFGELDLESIMGSDYERPKPFTPKAPIGETSPPLEKPTRQSIEAVKLAADETRIASATALADAVAQSRRPPPPGPMVDDECATRIGSFHQAVDGLVVEDAPASRNAPSASGVASRDDRVAVMRELYASGNAAEALALAASLELDGAESDPYGGLIPIDEQPVDESPSEDHTAIVAASANSRRLAALTSRQVPRLIIDVKEISRLPMDPRAAFILGHIDGIQTMEEILDVCAMPESDALELIEWLRTLNVIALD